MVSQEIANQLARRIESRKVAVGSYLPSMRELASRFNVSQHTIGMALKRLEAMRLVECLPRRGAKVTARKPFQETAISLKQIAVFVANGVDWINARRSGDWGFQIARNLERELFPDGYTLATLPVSHPVDDLSITLEERLDRMGSTLFGALCFTNANAAEAIGQLDRRQVPWVAVNRPTPQIDYNYVGADNHRAGWKVGRLFAASGFRRVLLLANSTSRFSTDSDKIAGVFQGYVEGGVPTDGLRTVSCGSTYEIEGYRAVRMLLEEGYRPQAIFATGDLLACGAMHALSDEGIRVPQDVSVIGATGLAASAEYDPPLSVVAQPMEELGRSAGRMLREMIAEGTRRHAARKLDCPFIPRASTNIPPKVLKDLTEELDLDRPAAIGRRRGAGAGDADL